VQTTIRSSVAFQGVGLHSGKPARLVIRPASAEHGIWFRRIDLGSGDQMVSAHWSMVSPSQLCTVVSNRHGASVSTIEHVMAALAGCGIHNALIDIDGPEVPILDGSAAPFVEGILTQGVRTLDAPVRAIRIASAVEVRDGPAYARLVPSDVFEIEFAIDFADKAIGKQRKSLNMSNGAFVRELSDSRTFCRKCDVDNMRARGLALGGSLSNAIVVDGDRVVNPGGLRHEDEAVRHKMLDALGDLALAGAPIFGRYEGFRAGHALTNRLLRALFARGDAFASVLCDASSAGRLPGVGLTRGDVPAVA